MKTVLTIAGSDCGGAGGVQADIKTITAHKLYATSAITAMTAQNTTGVYDIQESAPKFLARQLECIFEDIYPDAVKIGMVSNAELINVIADKLIAYQAKNIVLDSTIVSGSGRRLVGTTTEHILLSKLVPIADLMMMSMPQAEHLSGVRIKSIENLGAAAGIISEKYQIKNIYFKNSNTLIDKGDMLFENGRISWIAGQYEHGTLGKGCALSSAIACNLAKGDNLFYSVAKAKEYVQKAVKEQLELGKGKNPLKHFSE